LHGLDILRFPDMILSYQGIGYQYRGSYKFFAK